MSDIERIGKTTTFIYESGQLSSPPHAGYATTFSYSSPQATKDNEAAGDAEAAILPSGGEGTSQRQLETVLSRTLEFRLAGAEEQRQFADIPARAARALFAAATGVRAYVTQNGTASATRIGSVEVEVEIANGQMVCTARLTDFTNEDLVVVQVDVVVSAENRP